MTKARPHRERGENKRARCAPGALRLPGLQLPDRTTTGRTATGILGRARHGRACNASRPRGEILVPSTSRHGTRCVRPVEPSPAWLVRLLAWHAADDGLPGGGQPYLRGGSWIPGARKVPTQAHDSSRTTMCSGNFRECSGYAGCTMIPPSCEVKPVGELVREIRTLRSMSGDETGRCHASPSFILPA